MNQGYRIETVFENGRRVELDGLPTGPTGRELITAHDERRALEVAAGTAHWAQQDKEFRERQSTGKIEIEVARAASWATESAANLELVDQPR